MARRRNVYGRKRKIKYGRVMLLIVLFAAIVALVLSFFRQSDYAGVVDEVMKSDIRSISGTISTVSDIDVRVYSKNGIRYTNQHEKIKYIDSFESSKSEDSAKADNIKRLFENLYKLKKTEVLDDLPFKEDGYYWVDSDFSVKGKKLFFGGDEEYNFDLYYDIEAKKVYVKKEYFTEFSNKNNKQKFQGYEANDEFVKIIEELAGKKAVSIE